MVNVKLDLRSMLSPFPIFVLTRALDSSSFVDEIRTGRCFV